MEYVVNDKRYHFSYQELREEYFRVLEMTDRKFMKELVKISHLACFICYMKEVGPEASIGDKGIVHELIHLMQFGTGESLIDLKEIREQFKVVCQLA